MRVAFERKEEGKGLFHGGGDEGRSCMYNKQPYSMCEHVAQRLEKRFQGGASADAVMVACGMRAWGNVGKISSAVESINDCASLFTLGRSGLAYHRIASNLS